MPPASTLGGSPSSPSLHTLKPFKRGAVERRDIGGVDVVGTAHRCPTVHGSRESREEQAPSLGPSQGREAKCRELQNRSSFRTPARSRPGKRAEYQSSSKIPVAMPSMLTVFLRFQYLMTPSRPICS